jgi:hypothetical protein
MWHGTRRVQLVKQEGGRILLPFGDSVCLFAVNGQSPCRCGRTAEFFKTLSLIGSLSFAFRLRRVDFLSTSQPARLENGLGEDRGPAGAATCWLRLS